MSKQPPPAPTASAVGPCPTVIQIVGRPGTGSLPSTIAPPDHSHVIAIKYHIFDKYTSCYCWNSFKSIGSCSSRCKHHMFGIYDKHHMTCRWCMTDLLRNVYSAQINRCCFYFKFNLHILVNHLNVCLGLCQLYRYMLGIMSFNRCFIILKECWLVGCFGFNGLLRQNFSLYQAVSQRGEKEKRKDRREKKCPNIPHPHLLQ